MSFANYRQVTIVDDVCDIRIENCIESNEYVWTVIIHGNDYDYGYSPTKSKSMSQALSAYKDALARNQEDA